MRLDGGDLTLNDIMDRRLAAVDRVDFAFFSDAPSLPAANLDAYSRGLARILTSRGVTRETRVLLAAPTGPTQLALLLACWKLGAIVCPADPFLSGKAFASLIEMFKPGLVALDPALGTRSDLKSACEAHGIQGLELKLEERMAAPPIRDSNGPRPEDGALCIFTSGSTGKPKGVLLTHANLVAGTMNLIRAKALTERDRAFCVLPLSHINGLVTTFLSPLASGGSVFYWQRPFDANGALAAIDRMGCTWFSAIPTHYANLMSPPVEKRFWSLKTLRFCRSAAAPLSAKLLGEFEAYYGVPVLETMGMTECSGQIFANPLPPDAHKPGSVGVPVGFEARIVSENGSIRGVDERGEIQVRGPALTPGYLDSPEETALSIEGGWLKTGDLGHRDRDGYYFITGRKKDIAIFSGVNIPLRSLEAALEASVALRSVACVGETHPVFGETLAVYAVTRDPGADREALAREISNAVIPLLPSPQALKTVRFVANVPRSGVGKLLKGELGNEPVLYETQRTYSASPRELLAEVLGMPAAEIHPALERGSIAKWDSLAHVVLGVAVESVLNRTLSRREMAELRTYRGLERVLRGETAKKTPTLDSRQNQAARDLVKRLSDAGYGSEGINYLILTQAAAQKHGVEDPDLIVDLLLDALPGGQTLIMNAFTWAFYRTKTYHHANSPCETGVIGEVFRRTPGVVRGNHPVYSYIGHGPQAAELVRHESGTSWGKGSTTFKLLDAPSVRVITFGVAPLNGSPAIHALEETYEVPYRYFKTFTGIADFGRGPEPYSTVTYVRSLTPPVGNDWTPLFERMRKGKLLNYNAKYCLLSYKNQDLRRVTEEIFRWDRNALMVKLPT